MDQTKSDLTAHEKAVLMAASAASITTVLLKRGLRNQWMKGVRPTGPTRKVVGPAFTLRYIPAREDIDTTDSIRAPDHPQRVAIEATPADHVLVMDCRNDATAASCGSILAHRLAVRGVAGLVSDGGLRDADEATSFGLPCFTGGPSAPSNLTRHHAVEMQTPIGCGGVAVYPGDVIVGDGDGVVVIPREILREVIEQVEPMKAYEEFVHAQVETGSPLRGIYPPTDEGLARYEVWKAERNKSST